MNKFIAILLMFVVASLLIDDRYCDLISFSEKFIVKVTLPHNGK